MCLRPPPDDDNMFVKNTSRMTKTAEVAVAVCVCASSPQAFMSEFTFCWGFRQTSPTVLSWRQASAQAEQDEL